jgi:conjugal transfer pilus assembly protein TraF
MIRSTSFASNRHRGSRASARRIIGLLLCATVWAQTAQAQGTATKWWEQSIWRNDDRSQLWYPPEQAPEREKSPAPAAPPAAEPTPVQQLEAIQQRLKELRAAALIHPTPENMRAYIAYQEEHVGKRGSVFADAWRRALWESPELQYQFRPTNATAIDSYDRNYSQRLRGSLSSLASTHGVYFFFRSDCPFCHAMAPTLQMLQQRYGIKIMAISLDGRGIAEFPNAVANSGQAERLGVKSVPAFFLATPSTRTVAPLGTGVVSFSELEERIYTQAYTQPGEKF